MDAEYLERLARTYWKNLSRVSLGLIRVEYADTSAASCSGRPFVLLRFRAPEYELSAAAGSSAGGSATACSSPSRDEGYLEIDVRRGEADRPGYDRRTSRSRSRTSIPAIATWFARWLYKVTQSRIHVLVTHGFLRSLARRELEMSAVGRFAGPTKRRSGSATRRGRSSPPWWRRSPRPATSWSALSVAGGRARAASSGRGATGCAAPCRSGCASRATRWSLRARR